MRLFIFTCLVSFFCLAMTPCVMAQDNAKKDDANAKKADAEPKKAETQNKNAKLSEADVAAFEPLLAKYLNEEDGKPKSEAQEQLLKAMEDYSEKNKVSSPVADVDAWLGMFKRYNAEVYSKKKVYATGRIKTEEFTKSAKGEHYVFEYSLFVPKDYDRTKAWPVLVCLHDEDAKGLGKSYIKKVWQTTKESKALCEQFIILAPHFPERLARKKIKVVVGGKRTSVKTTAKKISWLNNYYLQSIIFSLHEVRKEYNCDPTRIFLEGVGAGGDAALTLAAMTPGRFAGVISRHGKLRDPELLNGLQFTPSMFLMREESKFAKGDGGAFWTKLKEAEAGKDKFTALQLETFPTLGKKKPSLKMLADQSSEPLYDANAKIAEFLTKHSIDPAPKQIRIVSNNRLFRAHAYLRVMDHDIAEGKILDCIAKFDREKNTVELTGSGFSRVNLFLNDSILDLSKPIQVLVNGKQVDARVPDRSASRMLKTFDNANLDYHRAITSLLAVPLFSLEPEKTEKKEDGEKGEKAAK